MKLNGLIFLSVVLCFLLSGCADGSSSREFRPELEEVGFRDTGYPICGQETVLTVLALEPEESGGRYEENKTLAEYETMTNVRIQWQYYQGDNASETITARKASGAEMPDIFLMTNLPNVLADNYIREGIFYPVDDLVDQFAPNLQASLAEVPAARKWSAAADGLMYAVPSILQPEGARLGGLPIINREWAETLELSLPETTEELYRYLKAVQTGDPNGNGQMDEIPFLLNWEQDAGDGNLFGPWNTCSAFIGDSVLYDSGPFFIRDNQVVAANLQPGYRDAVAYYHRLYREGLINTDALDGSAGGTAEGSETDVSRAGLYIGYSPSDLSKGGNTENYAYLTAWEGPGGSQHLLDPLYGIYPDNYISAETEYPEIAMRWMDGTAAPEISFQLTAEQADSGYIKRTGKYEFFDAEADTALQTCRTRPAPVLGLTAEWLSEHYRPTSAGEIERNSAVSRFLPWADMQSTEHLRYTEEEQQKLEALLPQIIQYSRQKEMEWIREGGVEEEWDAHQRRLKNMGIEEVRKIMQAACDRWNADK